MNDQNKLTTTHAPDAYGLIMAAVADDKCDPAKLRELLAVRREWNADEAAAAFNMAVVQFQNKCRIIGKKDTANGQRYAAIDRIWREVRPLMAECEIAVTWESVKVQDGETDKPVCVLDGHLRHSRGHAQPLHYELPIPKPIMSNSGRQVQNVAQAMGSATTYAKRYATCAALGIQTGVDDDGTSGTVMDTVTEAQAQELEEAIAATGTDAARFYVWAGCSDLAHFPAAKLREAMAMLAKKAGVK